MKNIDNESALPIPAIAAKLRTDLLHTNLVYSGPCWAPAHPRCSRWNLSQTQSAQSCAFGSVRCDVPAARVRLHSNTWLFVLVLEDVASRCLVAFPLLPSLALLVASWMLTSASMARRSDASAPAQ